MRLVAWMEAAPVAYVSPYIWSITFSSFFL